MTSTLKLLLVLVFAVGAFVLWASGGRGDERPIVDTPPHHMGLPSATDTISPGQLGIAAWNIAYGRGVEGDSSGPWSRSHIVQHLDGIADAIAGMKVDIVALQEVDLDSARSHHIHQGRYLAEKLGWAHFACVETWVQNYIPFPYWPPARHYGRMRSGQCLISRFPITRNTRHRLAQPSENPSWYNLFYLHRAIQSVSVEVKGETIDIFNVHLESFNSKNRQKQIQVLLELLGDPKEAGTILLGDFNALPPEATKLHGFPDAPKDDYRGDPSMSLVLDRPDFSETLRSLHGPGAPAHMTFPADVPNRRLDYLFVSKRFSTLEANIPDVGGLSDHLPIAAKLSL